MCRLGNVTDLWKRRRKMSKENVLLPSCDIRRPLLYCLRSQTFSSTPYMYSPAAHLHTNLSTVSFSKHHNFSFTDVYFRSILTSTDIRPISKHPSIYGVLLVCLLPLLGHPSANVMACIYVVSSYFYFFYAVQCFIQQFLCVDIKQKRVSGHRCLVRLSVYSGAESFGFSSRQFNNSEDSSSIHSASLSLSSSTSPLLKALLQHQWCIARDRLLPLPFFVVV